MTDQQDRTVSNWNLPNALTTLRIVLVPVYGWFLLGHDHDSILWRCLAYGVFAVAMITDKIDGDLARSRGQVTDFGKIADPIADKAMTGMAFIALSIVGDIWWWVTVVVLLREWGVTLLRLSVARNVVIAAAQSGKVKTMLQVLALGLLTLPLRQLDSWADTPGDVVFYVSQVLLAGAVAMTMWSGYEFFREFRRQRRGTVPAV
ncbi:MAG: pgsA2 1 [Nocardioides sp.]|nr:pgsA2 1 [Nocardioides sp.]